MSIDRSPLLVSKTRFI